MESYSGDMDNYGNVDNYGNMDNYNELIKKGVSLLMESGMQKADAMRETEMLMAAAAGKDRTFLFLHGRDVPEGDAASRFSEMVRRRADGEPLQYITGIQEFMGLEFEVNENVLIPRQDTETLVELALKEARNMQDERTQQMTKTSRTVKMPHMMKTMRPVKMPRTVKESVRGEGEEEKIAAEEVACKRETEDGKADGDALANASGPAILDLCCGSGAIAVAMARFLPEARLTASDVSGEAVAAASRNAERNSVSHRITFIQSDMFANLIEREAPAAPAAPAAPDTAPVATLGASPGASPGVLPVTITDKPPCAGASQTAPGAPDTIIDTAPGAPNTIIDTAPDATTDKPRCAGASQTARDTAPDATFDAPPVNDSKRMKFDMILTNPPYIPEDVIKTLQTEVRDHEPHLALSGGEDGLDFYRIIAKQAHRYMKDGACLMAEIGHDQGASVSELLASDGHYCSIKVHRDLAGHDRVVTCKKLLAKKCCP